MYVVGGRILNPVIIFLELLFKIRELLEQRSRQKKQEEY